jgi:hypothetical protein
MLASLTIDIHQIHGMSAAVDLELQVSCTATERTPLEGVSAWSSIHLSHDEAAKLVLEWLLPLWTSRNALPVAQRRRLVEMLGGTWPGSPGATTPSTPGGG